MRTTGLQVSGFNFLLRRLELALVIGDPRMAHDPLRSQRRAQIVGVLLSCLIAGGAVMLGLLRPQPSIDSADLVADETGTLHLRLDDRFHPITNVASARLVLRKPVEVHTSTAQQLAEFPTGEPMGIPTVPGLAPAEPREWMVCDPGTVVATESSAHHEHAVLTAPSGTWLITGTTRALIDPQGARALGATPVQASDRAVGAFRRAADIAMPTGLTGLPAPFDVAGRVIHSGERAFLTGAGGVAELTGLRRDFAEAMTPHAAATATLAEVMAHPSASLLTGIPESVGSFATPPRVCTGQPGLMEPTGPAAQSIHTTLEADNPPAYLGPRGTSALRTERGYVLVTDTGQRFLVGSQEDLRALGFDSDHPTTFHTLSLLPDAGLLTEQRARHSASGRS